MNFRLRSGLGQSAVREIGSHLRSYGTGHHWVERFRGETYVHPGDERDEAILLEEFALLVEPIAEPDDK